jgi:hypothetical protein
MDKLQGSAPRPDLLPVLQQVVGGRVYHDVSACVGSDGGWPVGTADHRLDAVVVASHAQPAVVAWDEHADEFAVAAAEADLYVAAVRQTANRPLLGLLLAGGDLLVRSYPRHGLLHYLAVVADPVEPNVGWTYRVHGVRVIQHG